MFMSKTTVPEHENFNYNAMCLNLIFKVKLLPTMLYDCLKWNFIPKYVLKPLKQIAVIVVQHYRVCVIELSDIKCAFSHVTGVKFDKTFCPYKSVILDFLL